MRLTSVLRTSLHSVRDFSRDALRLARVGVSAGVMTLPARPLLAQAATAPDTTDSNVCFGFSFATWTPPLDSRGAGHAAVTDSSQIPRAPDGRGWAASLDSSAETSLLLFPTWWPVGVSVEVPHRPLASGDTVSGTAVALVADGRTEPPRSRVRVWRVPCRRPPPADGSGGRDRG